MITKEQRDLADSSKTLEAGTERLIKTLTGVTKTSDGVASGFVKMWKETGKFGDALGKLGATVAETFTGMNAGISTFKKFAEGTVALSLSVDSARAAFNKATGTGGRYNDVIKAAEYRNRQLGVSANEAQAATQQLLSGFTEFLMMSEAGQKDLAATVAQFETFGVAAANTTKFLEAVTRTTGRSIQQAQRLQKSVMATAKAFGDNLNEVMQETAEVMPKLAIHGQNLEGVLDDLYSASKRTGMGMSEIIGLAERFDTFEGAADAAGNLNAVLGSLGGQPLVDTMQILETTNPAERMQLFADAVEQSVGNFEDLGYYQQKAIANAMGLTVEETRRIMLQEEQSSRLDAALARRNLSEKDYLALQKNARSVMDDLKILAMQFAAALEMPLQMLSGTLTKITKVLGGIKSLFGGGKMGTLMAGVVGVGGMALGGKLLSAGLSRIPGVGKFMTKKPDGSDEKPFHVILKEGAAEIGKGLADRMRSGFNRLTGRYGAPGGRIGPSLPPGSGGGMGGMFMGAGGRALTRATTPMWGSTAAATSRMGKMGRFARSGLGMGMGAGLLGMAVGHGAEKGSGRSKAGKALEWGGAGAALGSFLPGPGTLIGGALGAGAGAIFGADGGIVTKPSVGVIGEGGQNEAIVPLPNGRAIPVDMSGSELAELLKANNSKLDNLISIMGGRETVLIKSDLAAAMMDINRARTVVT